MAKDDLTFKLNEVDVFNYRVCAYIHNKTKTFLHLSHDAEHWNLIGGRVKIHEDSLTALIRELDEELHYIFLKEQFNIRSLNENFFYHMGRHATEILIIYDLELPDEHPLAKIKSFVEDETIFKWFKTSDVTREKLFCLPVQIYDLVKEDLWAFRKNVVRED